MANLTGTAQAFHGDTATVDTSQLAPLGMRAWDEDGAEYIYLQGVGSTVAGDWVVFDENYATTRLVANEVGPVAIAMAAINATTSYGWYQIFGKNTIARTDTVAADKSLYIDGTAGRADDAGIAGDLIVGAYSMTADSSNVATVWLTYPHVSDDLGGGIGGTPGGSDTQLQYNSSSSFAGISGATSDGTNVMFGASALRIADTNASHYLIITPGSDLTANRVLTITTGDAARTLTIGADSSISGTAYVVGGTDVALADGGTGKSAISALSIWVANSANVLTEVTPGAGNSVRVNAGGTAWEAFTPSASVPTTITVANEATDTTCYLAFFTAATGDLGPKTNANMTLDSSTGIVTFASTVLTTTDINGGTIDGATIGGASAAAITGTTITANTGFMPDANDGSYLGQSGTAFSDLFLADGGVINWNAGNATLTHSTGLLTSNVAMSLGTSNAMTLGSIELGHASDTTITRVSAGVAAIEGVNILTTAGATLTGKIHLGEGADPATIGIQIDESLSADERYSGIVVSGTAGATLAFGDLCYLDVTATEWLLADADAASTAGDVILGICVDASTDGNATSMLLLGTVRSAAFPGSIALGAPVYVDVTAGDITATKPSGTDDVIRRVGWAVTAEPNTIFFNPSNDYVTAV